MNIKKIAALILSFCLCAGLAFSQFNPAIPAAGKPNATEGEKSASGTGDGVETLLALAEEASVNTDGTAGDVVNALSSEFTARFYTDFKVADTLYCIDQDRISFAEHVMISSLSGILAQEAAQIFIYDRQTKIWLDIIKKTYNKTIVEVLDPWELVERFKSKINQSGYVKYTRYDASKTYLTNPSAPCSINVATVISGQERYLMIEEMLEPVAIRNGLVKKADPVADVTYELDIFEEYLAKGTINKDVVTSLAYVTDNMRDVAVAMKAMCWRDSDMSDFSMILSQLNDNGVVLGWHDDEGAGVRTSSMNNFGTIFSFITDNIPVYAGVSHENIRSSPYQKYESDSKKVHYVAFIESDGDALSSLERNFPNQNNMWVNKNRGAIPFGWSVTASLAEFAPVMMNRIYSTATLNDSIVGALCASYTMPELFQPEALERHAYMTSEYMKAVGQRYSTFMSNNMGSDEDVELYIRDIVPAYAAQNGIQGAYIQYANDGYLSINQKGSIYWVNDKPFIHYRETMAAPGWGADLNVEYHLSEVIGKMAYRINRYKKDATVIEGYTLINVHPWSTGYNYCVDLVDLFDEDVIVVSPIEFMDLIKKNVEHKDVKRLNDVTQFNYTDMPINANRLYMPLIDIELKRPTTQLDFNFNNGAGGWVMVAGQGAQDYAHLADMGGGERAVKLCGSSGELYLDDITGSMYNKIVLPAGTTKVQVVANTINASDIRIQVLNAQNQLTTVKDFTALTGTDTTYEADISRYAGQTVTISIQYHDKSRAGSAALIKSVKVI